MNLSRLRKKHPSFIYHSFELKQDAKQLQIQFRFILEPKTEFKPQVTIPLADTLPQEELENFVFHLGLIEAISYWKVACPPQLIIRAGHLDQNQIKWWHDLFIHGLGEFFYQNRINPNQRDFLTIISQGPRLPISQLSRQPRKGSLILVGGGRDSAVSLELFKRLAPSQNNGTLVIQTTTRIDAALNIIRQAGYPPPLIVTRTLDPKMLKLNRQGYLNGHIPISAVFAFIGLLVAALHGFREVVVANERSANEKNITYQGLEINHQYSKSFRFERRFRQYAFKYLSSQINYFSLLRPLYELQISKLFSCFSQYHLAFLSCNPGQKTNVWCGKCPKCAFVYLSLAPFLPAQKMKKIFGRDYFSQPKIITHLKQLVGVQGHKPLDCVGTRAESILALGLTLERYRREGRSVPSILLALEKKLKLDQKKIAQLREKILYGWSPKHFLPAQYAQLLKQMLRQNVE